MRNRWVGFVAVGALLSATMGCGSGSSGEGFGDGGVPMDSGPGGHVGDGGTGMPDTGPGTQPDGQTPGCTPLACEEVDKDCGQVADGCGGWMNCGTCGEGEFCGGGGPNVCGGPPDCEPATCEALGKDCGAVADGCGSTIQCGECDTAAGEACGRYEPNVCDAPNHDPHNCPALRTCEDVGAECGTISNGCGGTADCGTCDEPGEHCGGDGVPNECGAASCTPRTCDEANPEGTICGAIPDGCGGLIEGCGMVCEAPETCGGAGVPGACGIGESDCVPMDEEEACFLGDCGPRSDGCGGTVECGGCDEGETCGGGDSLGVCGAPPCVPRDCDYYDANCGTLPDGCGGEIECGNCTAPESCGGTGTPNRCGDPDANCQPRSCEDQGIGCGMAGDGCGGEIHCGSCPSSQTCGGGGVPSQCGAPPCEPLTVDDCEDEGVGCGPMADGCGGLVESCGGCPPPSICGGGGEPSQCGGGGGDNGGIPCEGLCEHQVYCEDGAATTLTGRVYAPNGVEPLFNAMVYVPNGELPAITDGVSCDRCEDEDLGNPLVSAITGPDGSFELRHVPADIGFPLVIKMGKWRRVVQIPAVEPCDTRELTPSQTRLPRHRGEGSIPRIAVSTGHVDALECVLYKAGLDESEFTRPDGDGRVHLYRANGAWQDQDAYNACLSECSCGDNCGFITCLGDGWCGARYNCLTACAESTGIGGSLLYADQATLDSYDVAMFGCEASAQNRPQGARQRLLEYLNKGGRVFLSHWNLDWIENEGYSTVPLSDTADWGGVFMGDLDDPTEAFVDTSFSRGESFSAWLDHVNASTSPGVVNIDEPRAHVVSTTEHGRGWIYTTDQDHGEDSIQYLTFNTPVGEEEQNLCGRGVYTAFHVATGDHRRSVFPNHCGGALTPQEKVLLYMMFDLAACVSDDGSEPVPPPTCEPRTCASVGAECGFLADGCGGALNCGTCPDGELCGGGGEANQCGSGCVPTTCEAAGADCGYIADGCGGSLNCGGCPWPQGCGAVSPNRCDLPQCTPRTCEDVGAECGYVADGCEDTVFCGTCPDGTTCGGDGLPNQCGAGSCVPQGCGDAECGSVGDGCGGVAYCGECPLGQFCGGDGVPNQCSGDPCPRLTCGDVDAECGLIGDGCGGTRDCGQCPEPTICGGGGVPNQCGGGCEPLSCEDQGAECGFVGDGCGDGVECGPCPPGQTCGAGGMANQCGDGPACVPDGCGDAECGLVGDGCGDVVDCGECPEGQVCGGGGVPYQCGGCEPLTCAEANAECGQVADGCGDILDCGGCPSNNICQSRTGGGTTCTPIG
jgi:hypothetical protein